MTHLLPLHRQVEHHLDAEKNNYFLISGGGYPRLLDELGAAVENIRESRNYGCLVVCLDVEDEEPIEKRREIEEALVGLSPGLPVTTEPRIILQQRCLETWFLGNRSMFRRHPNCQTLRGYIDEYNVSEECPELLGMNEGFATHAAFHMDYLKRMLKERGLEYSKTRPRETLQRHYLQSLVERVRDTNQLSTFHEFVRLCRWVRGYSDGYHMSLAAE